MTDSDDGPNQADRIDHRLHAIDVARIVDSGPFGYVTAGHLDIIDGINRTLCEWLGRTPESVIGEHTFQDLLAPGDRIYYDTHIRPMLSMQHEVSEIAVQLVCADGRRLPVLMNSILRVDADGSQRVEAVVIDATERRRYEQELLYERQLAQESEARLRVMYDVVSGLAGATTVEEVIALVTERGERSIAGARCSVWLFDAELRSVVRALDDDDAKLSYDLEGNGPALVDLARGDLLLIEDAKAASKYPLLSGMLLEAGHVSATVAPLTSDGVLHGVMTFGFEEPHQFSESDQRAMSSLAAQTEQALQRTRSMESERRSRARLERLFRFSARLSAAVSVDDVLQVIAGDSFDLLGAISVRLGVVDDTRSAVRFVRGVGQEDDAPTLALDSNAMACVAIRTGQAQFANTVNDVRTRYPDSQILHDDGIGRVVAVPLVGDREVLGAWVLAYAEPGPADADDVRLLHLFAEQASQATGRAFFHQNEASARARADTRLAISESLNAAVTVEDLGQAITIQGRKAFDAAGLVVYMADRGADNSLNLLASVGIDERSPLHDVTLSQADFLAIAPTDNLVPVFLEGPAVASLGDDLLAGHPWKTLVLLPMVVSGQMMGLVVVGFDDSRVVAPGTRVALTGLAAEATSALSRAQRYELEHEVALTLQSSLLPTDLTPPEGWRISARYEPGSEELVVGGDLFDTVRTHDGRLFVIVGDVVGHGLHAAAAMGQLRSAARALALVSSEPADIMEGLEVFARSTPGVLCATVACVAIEPDGDAVYACAGHPYPILVHKGGETELLTQGRSVLLGVSREPRQMAQFHMDEGDCLVLYTDGIIEHDDASIDDGIQLLQDTLTDMAAADDLVEAHQVVDRILGGSSARDDIVVVCVTRVAP